jgi:hypothetical protein
MIDHTWYEHVNHYTTDAVYKSLQISRFDSHVKLLSHQSWRNSSDLSNVCFLLLVRLKSYFFRTRCPTSISEFNFYTCAEVTFIKIISSLKSWRNMLWLKMFTLKYVPGALPGKALKRKISAEEIRNRQSSYEAKRKDRPWLCVRERSSKMCSLHRTDVGQ